MTNITRNTLTTADRLKAIEHMRAHPERYRGRRLRDIAADLTETLGFTILAGNLKVIATCLDYPIGLPRSAPAPTPSAAPSLEDVVARLCEIFPVINQQPEPLFIAFLNARRQGALPGVPSGEPA